ncbi:hypothetical protein KJ786_02495 [Patescibacteria group bacterium]|nr:hypothetical protein [Patescibacteria group bacterium]
MKEIVGSREKKYTANDLTTAINGLLNRFLYLRNKRNLTNITNETINTLAREDKEIQTLMACITKSSGLREKVLQFIKVRMRKTAKDMDEINLADTVSNTDANKIFEDLAIAESKEPTTKEATPEPQTTKFAVQSTPEKTLHEKILNFFSKIFRRK